jgi:hypothetical protein
LASYSSFKLEHTLTVATDSLGTPGTIYRAKILAVNKEDIKSLHSNECLFALGALPSQPSAVTKNDQLSGALSIYVEWSKLQSETLPVLGYMLYADTGKNDDLRLIYDGSTNPQIAYFVYTAASNEGEALNNAYSYRFQVAGVNFNGEGT